MKPEAPSQSSINSPLPVRTGKNVVLVGYMGTGKSCIGRHIAQIGNRTFVDTDDVIQQRAGMTIPEIFAEEGHDAFRARETEALKSLLQCRGHVIATGGGIVTQPRNLPLLEQLGFVVWLRADEEVLFERVSRNADRPLLQTVNPRETLRQMIRERTPLYEQASQFVIDTSWLRPADLAGAVLNEMRRRGL